MANSRRRRRHTPEQIVRKLRDADAMLNGGKDEAAVLQALEISEAAFVAGSIRRWLKLDDVETLYIEPGSPWKNGYAESFPSRLRDEFLAIEEFESLRVARRLSTQWQDYNNQRL